MTRTMSNLIATVVGVTVLLLGIIASGPAQTQESNLPKKAYAPASTWGCPWWYPDCQVLVTPIKTLDVVGPPVPGNVGGTINKNPA